MRFGAKCTLIEALWLMVATRSSTAARFYTTSEVAKVVGVSRQTIQTWIADGKIKAPPLVGTTRIWSKSQVEELKRNRPKTK